MPARAPISDQVGEGRSQNLPITDGEIHFLWWFIQGSIMDPETWNALLRAYGLCARHAWAHLNVEIAFRERHLLGPVILYRALIEQTLQAIQGRQYTSRSPLRRLKAAAPCLLCALDINRAGSGAAPRARLDRGRDSSGLRSFATSLAPFWRAQVCAICADDADQAVAFPRCRQHLLADLSSRKPIDFIWQQSNLRELAARLAKYEGSFVFGADRPSNQDRSALISAAGWCSGWRPLLELLGRLPAQ
jgi:hypothetical protein